MADPTLWILGILFISLSASLAGKMVFNAGFGAGFKFGFWGTIIAIVMIYVVIPHLDFFLFWLWQRPGYMPIIPGFFTIVPATASFLIAWWRFRSTKEGRIAFFLASLVGPGAILVFVATIAARIHRASNSESYSKPQL